MRWSVLLIMAIVMMMGYVFWDIVSPLSTTLKAPVAAGGMSWTATEYGFYAGAYSIFNIFLLMLFIGGLILDKFGIRLTGVLATGMMLGGALINYYALDHISPATSIEPAFTLFGLIPSPIKQQVLAASLGFGLFGVGCDMTGITVSKVITKWFTGHELASAMGIQVAMARLGTAAAISFSPLIARTFGLSAPLWAGAVILLIGFALFLVYLIIDRRFDARKAQIAQVKAATAHDGEPESEQFSFADFKKVLLNRGFWLIVVLCVLFYSSLRPFLKFATDLLINKYGMDSITAGWVTSILPYGTIALTPLFGHLFDRYGRGSRLMLIGCLLVTAGHLLLALPIAGATWLAATVMVLLGISYSLVPSALWPSVPGMVPLKQLGTAYSIIYYIQNIGLMLVPIGIGHVIDHHTDARGIADFTMPTLIFAAFGAGASAVAYLLMRKEAKK